MCHLKWRYVIRDGKKDEVQREGGVNVKDS